MYYGTISTGFESGGVNDTGGSSLIPSSYAPQKVTAYEVGAKNRLLQGLVQTELSLFYNDYRNLQINVYTPQVSYFGSAGKAYSEGAEFAARTLPLPDLHVDRDRRLSRTPSTPATSAAIISMACPMAPTPISVNLKPATRSRCRRNSRPRFAAYYDWNLGQLRHHLALFQLAVLQPLFHHRLQHPRSIKQHSFRHARHEPVRWTSENPANTMASSTATTSPTSPCCISGVVGRDERIQVSYGPPALYGFRIGAKVLKYIESFLLLFFKKEALPS